MIRNGGDGDDPYSVVPTLEQLYERWRAYPRTPEERQYVEQYRDRVYHNETFFTEAMIFPMVLGGQMGACTIVSTPRAAQVFTQNMRDAAQHNLITFPYWTQWDVWHSPGCVAMNIYNARRNGHSYGTLEHVMDTVFSSNATERQAWRERYCMLMPGPGVQHKSYLRQLIFEKTHAPYIHEVCTGLSQAELMGIDLYTRITTPGAPIERFHAYWILNVSKPPFHRPYMQAADWWNCLDWVSYGQSIPPGEWALGPVRYVIDRTRAPGSML